ncbi:MAG: TolC family protein [Proteobacteria bacterium]|nr:TolC family protein [Pseudomonadota bacterium]
MRRAWLLCCAIGLAPAAHAQQLSFSDAVAQAAASGPTIDAGSAALSAAQHARRAAGRLPDPELVLGLENVPVSGPDRYRLDRDQMTMARVGVMQSMPSAAVRSAERAAADADTERATSELGVARLTARVGAADAWIRLFFATRRQAVFNRLAVEARASAQAARARLAAGGSGVDDALAAQIDATRVEDRESEANAAVAAARADLERWIGPEGEEPLSDVPPVFAVDPDMLREQLDHHPELAALGAERANAAAEIGLARARTHPDWSWEVAYGRRDPSFGDMASVEVRVSLPLFQGDRQRPLIQARQADLARAEAERAAAVREHLARLESQLAEYQALAANLARARETLLPLAQRRAAAAAGAHAAGALSTTGLIAARAQALEAEMEVIDLQERIASLGAALTLQYGEQAR